MAQMNVNRITNANVYLADESQLGKSEEISIPELVTIMTEHKSLGGIGKIELPAGFEKMTGKIKWNSLYEDVAAKTANPRKAYPLQVRSNIERHSAQGLVDEIPMVTFMTVQFKKAPFGVFKAHENAEFESEFSCTYLKQVINGKTIVEVDFFTNTFMVNGEDLVANYNANLGLA